MAIEDGHVGIGGALQQTARDENGDLVSTLGALYEFQALEEKVTDLEDITPTGRGGLTEEQVETLVEAYGYQTAAQVMRLIATYGFVTATVLDGRGYQTAEQVEALVEAYGYQTAAQVMATLRTALDHSGYQTLAQVAALVEAYGYQTSAQVLATLSDGRYLRYERAWAADVAYGIAAVVRNGTANYLCVAPVAANTGALTEPGSGTRWRDYWLLLGHQVNNPDAFTGVMPGDSSFTLTRAGGEQPIEVSLIARATSGTIPSRVVLWETENSSSGTDVSRQSGFSIVDGYMFSEFDEIAVWTGGGMANSRYVNIFNPNDIGNGIYIRGESGQNFYVLSGTKFRIAGTGQDNEGLFKIYGYKFFGGEPPDPSPPSITSFVVSGKQHVEAGTDISGARYTFETQVAQAARASAVRIVGYAGAAVVRPASQAVLTTLGSADFAHASGGIQIPNSTVLANVGDAYNLRLEVYADGLTPGTDAPTTYQDYRITAIAAAAKVHFGYLRSDRAAGQIVFADNDIEVRGSVVGTWTNAGVPEGDGHEYLNYLAVPASLPQPADFTSAGLPADASWDEAVRETFDGTQFLIYITNANLAAGGSDWNGLSWGVTT